MKLVTKMTLRIYFAIAIALALFAPPAGVEVFPGLTAALADCRQRGEGETFIIGGADVYRKALADDIHLRRGLNVHAGKITYQAVAEALKMKYQPAEEALGL